MYRTAAASASTRHPAEQRRRIHHLHTLLGMLPEDAFLRRLPSGLAPFHAVQIEALVYCVEASHGAIKSIALAHGKQIMAGAVSASGRSTERHAADFVQRIRGTGLLEEHFGAAAVHLNRGDGVSEQWAASVRPRQWERGDAVSACPPSGDRRRGM